MSDRIEYLHYVFLTDQIFKIKKGLAESLDISALEIDTFDVEVKCSNPSILNFHKNDPLTYYRDEEISSVYHVQSILRVGPDRYAISAVSPLGLLSQMDHYGGIYTGQTAQDVISEICGGVSVMVKTVIQGIKLYGWLPIAKARDNLRQVLFAINANLTTDNNGVLRVAPLWNGLTSVIEADRIYVDGADVEQLDPVTSVTVLEHQYIPGSERRDLYEGTTISGQRITWDSPMLNLVATGFKVLSSGANYAIVSAGSGKLTGAEYVHVTTEVTRQVTSAQARNDVRVEDATLVSLVNSASVAERLADYYACRSVINLDMIAQRESPGKVVQILDPYDDKMQLATISSSQEQVSAITKASISALVGFSPIQSENIEYFDRRIVLTGSGNWTPPEGAVELQVVLISGGQGGYSGLMGELAKDGTASSPPPAGNQNERRYSTGEGGDGGLPGQGGSGGKVFRFTMKISSLTAISYRCGVGGVGGVATRDNSNAIVEDASRAGAIGTDTVFGSYSSAAGSVVPYYDPVTGETYGGKGSTGVAGGKGGGLDPDGAYASQKPGPNLVYKGVTYKSGANNIDVKEAFGYFKNDDTQVTSYGSYGAGGGAAAGANGAKATSAPIASVTTSTFLSNGRAVAYGGRGGKGGDAVAPSAQTKIGFGGIGGNGGGGAGASGASAVISGISGSSQIEIPSFPGDTVVGAESSYESRGFGSNGGQGGPGGIIVYCRIRSKEAKRGILVTKKKNFVTDRTGRLFIT